MRILGIDYGDARIGLAVCDPMGWTAQGLETISNVKDGAVDKIMEYVRKYEVGKIVLGLPKNMDGSVGFRTEATLEFSKRLKEQFEGEIVLWDERLSTVAALRTLNESNVRGKKRKSILDTVAAVYILQGYLDSL